MLSTNYDLDNAEKSNMLFIFDDIWNQDYFEYLTFAKKSIVTSRYNIKNKIICNEYHCIPATVRDLFHFFMIIVQVSMYSVTALSQAVNYLNLPISHVVLLTLPIC